MEPIMALLAELERFGRENDARVTAHADRMLNITRDTGEFLLVLVRAIKARRILEIGTSNGYSTLWLARAVQPLGGRVTTVESAPRKAEMARENFARAGLSAFIDAHLADALQFLAEQPAASFDLVFLDTTRALYPEMWADMQRVLVSGGLVVADNAVSHVQEMEPFASLVGATPGYVTALVPVGKGELLILKEAAPGRISV